MEEQEAGHQKAPTLEGAIKDLEDQGYILENLASKSGKDLLWSQSENQFLLNTEGKSGKDYWKIVDAVPEQADQKYSYYAGKNFNQTDVTVKYGCDAGRIDNIGKVTYVGTGTAQEVAIRTNGLMCDLTINAPNDSVKHYGEAQSINVIAVKSASYHEYGASPFISINTGRIVLEDGAQVEALHVNSSSAILAIASNEQLPTVTIEDGVTTFTVQTTQDNNGQVIGTANVTVAAGGVITVSTEISALSGTTIVETKDEEDAKGEAITNSDLVFQVKGSWEEVAANARAVLNDYLRAYNSPTSVLPSSQDYTPEELSDVIAGLKNYYVEVGTIHINIDTILLNGVERSSNEVFGLSIASYRFVRANYFKVENNKLYLAAPVAAFELNTGGSLKINKTNISLGTTVENSLTVKTVHNAKNGTEFSAHEDDAYSFDISKASTTSYTSLAFNEITSSADGPIVTRKLYTYTDGTKQLSYGLSTIDGPNALGDGNFGIWMYITGYPVNSTESGTHIDYSLYFMGADKTCALHFDIVD